MAHVICVGEIQKEQKFVSFISEWKRKKASRLSLWNNSWSLIWFFCMFSTVCMSPSWILCSLVLVSIGNSPFETHVKIVMLVPWKMSFRLLSSMHGTYCYVQPADIRNPRTPYVPSKFCDPLKDAHPKIFALEHGNQSGCLYLATLVLIFSIFLTFFFLI